MSDRPTLIVLRGLPGAGKTTTARQMQADARAAAGRPGTLARVSRDDIREHVLGLTMTRDDAVLDREGEAGIVTAIETSMVEAALAAGVDVVVDATHLSPHHLERWQTVAVQHRADLDIRTLDVSAEECIRRDEGRAAAGDRSVGADVIRRMAASSRPTYDRPRLGWPWSGDVPTSGQHRGDAIATQHDDGTITLAWDPDDATCTIVSRAVRLVVDTELQRGRVYAVRIPGGHTVWDLSDALREVAERTGTSLIVFRDGATTQELVDEALGAVRAELERLGFVLRTRIGDLERFLDEALEVATASYDTLTAEVARIRREAGLT